MCLVFLLPRLALLVMPFAVASFVLYQIRPCVHDQTSGLTTKGLSLLCRPLLSSRRYSTFRLWVLHGELPSSQTAAGVGTFVHFALLQGD